MSIIIDYKGENSLFIKGASEMVLKSCDTWFNSQSDTIEDLNSTQKNKIE